MKYLLMHLSSSCRLTATLVTQTFLNEKSFWSDSDWSWWRTGSDAEAGWGDVRMRMRMVGWVVGGWRWKWGRYGGRNRFEEKAVSHPVLIIMRRDLEHLKVGRLCRQTWGLSVMSAIGFHFTVSRCESAITTASKCGSGKPSGCENQTQS